FRASEKFDKQVGAVAAWLRRAEVEATAVECEPFDKQGFTKELQSLRSLTCEPNPEQFIPELKKRCARHGVAVVFIAAPSGCPASGATKWLGSEKAMLVLSLRYKTNDHLWFTFFHEVGHLLKHGKRMFFIEGLEGLDLEAEEQANRFARDLLIPPSSLQALYDLSRKPYLSKQDVADFARSIHVAPGIVVGRMQHEDWLPQSHMNKLKERYQWAASN
ncbi:MAG: ImmA/IrrE family metallo-endopeptidase, partial [Bradymonadaceae bacterium]